MCDVRSDEDCCISMLPSSHTTKHRFELVVRDLALSTTRTVHANFILACHGVHGRQLTPADRGLPVSKDFQGIVTLGGRVDDVDSAVGTSSINGKVCTCAVRAHGPQPVFLSMPMLVSTLQAAYSLQKHTPRLHRRQQGWALLMARYQQVECHVSVAGCGGAGRGRFCMRGHARGRPERRAHRHDGHASQHQVRAALISFVWALFTARRLWPARGRSELDRRMHESRAMRCAGGSCHSRGSTVRRR